MTISIYLGNKKMKKFERVIKRGLTNQIKVKISAKTKNESNKISGLLEKKIREDEEFLSYAMESPSGNLITLGKTHVYPVKPEVYETIAEYCKKELGKTCKVYIEKTQLLFILH